MRNMQVMEKSRQETLRAAVTAVMAAIEDMDDGALRLQAH